MLRLTVQHHVITLRERAFNVSIISSKNQRLGQLGEIKKGFLELHSIFGKRCCVYCIVADH